jgi:HEPN domain-containing protein
VSSPGPELEFARALARKAREDLDALMVLHERAGIADAVIGFHAQQAVEKALKAAIVVSGGELRRTHDLRFLIEQAEDQGVSIPDDVQAAAWLTPWAVELRYDELLEEQLDRHRAARTATAAVDMADRLVA